MMGNNQNIQISAWLWALFSVLVLWGVNNVVLGFSAQVLHANYLIYTCSAFASSALCLLVFGGRGPLVKETLRSIDTWAFGLIMLLGYILTLSLFSYVSSTEGSMLQRVSMLFSILISWIFLSRQPSWGQLFGALLVLFGIGMVVKDVPAENAGIIYMLMFLEGLALTGRMFVAEIHRPHQIAVNLNKDPRAKARVVGFVMFVISTFFLSLTVLIATIQSYTPLPFETAMLPTLNDFRHAPSIFAGLLAGVLLISPLRVIEFSSAAKIKSENFLALASFSVFATMFWEWMLSPITGMSLRSLTMSDILAGAIITTGSLVAALSVVRKQKQKHAWEDFIVYSGQDPQAVDDSREIVASSLEHFDGDIKKAAVALSVEPEAIQAMLQDKNKVLAFKPAVLKSVARQYRHRVAASDALTGLLNRSGLLATLKTLPLEVSQFSLLFIDLDKFKPVNDTYGHDAGDFVLKGIGGRLRGMFGTKCMSARLGGDEFCMILLDTDAKAAKDYAKKVKSAVAEPFEWQGNKLVVGASIGIATYPDDSDDAQALLKLADEGMYKVKKSR